ncbi:MAG TPA: TIGR01777 family oxidoreductase [Pyrinomonadaceae bacterium]|nr:TIGR01777 family oxidoreductase [Pyrinomonadaceae bacterium]
MKILVTGASGLVGTALTESLSSKGHKVMRLVRSQPVNDSNEIKWNPQAGEIDAGRLEGLDAVVHLAGENISEGRWTDEKKRRIRESRVKGTQLLSETLARMERKPRVLVAASAIGFYGDRGAEVLTEKSASGDDFLSEVCREWELATRPASQSGIRVVNFRIGVILSDKGGALAKMITPFKFGLGGKIGSGEQYMSWVALEDVVGAIEFAFESENLSGPVNLVSPNAVTNLEFTKSLGDALSRPTFFFVPAFAARAAFGEMADALLLSSARVEPERLKEAGYQFKYSEIEKALRHILKSA